MVLVIGVCAAALWGRGRPRRGAGPLRPPSLRPSTPMAMAAYLGGAFDEDEDEEDEDFEDEEFEDEGEGGLEGKWADDPDDDFRNGYPRAWQRPAAGAPRDAPADPEFENEELWDDLEQELADDLEDDFRNGYQRQRPSPPARASPPARKAAPVVPQGRGRGVGGRDEEWAYMTQLDAGAAGGQDSAGVVDTRPIPQQIADVDTVMTIDEIHVPVSSDMEITPFVGGGGPAVACGCPPVLCCTPGAVVGLGAVLRWFTPGAMQPPGS